MASLTNVCQAILIMKISSSDLSWTLNLKSIILAIFSFPKYKAHSEKNSLQYIHNLGHIQYIPYFALFSLGKFFAESWLNFHIPLHTLYLAVGKEKDKEIKNSD